MNFSVLAEQSSVIVKKRFCPWQKWLFTENTLYELIHCFWFLNYFYFFLIFIYNFLYFNMIYFNFISENIIRYDEMKFSQCPTKIAGKWKIVFAQMSTWIFFIFAQMSYARVEIHHSRIIRVIDFSFLNLEELRKIKLDDTFRRMNFHRIALSKIIVKGIIVNW